MHPGALNKKLSAACTTIASQAEQFAAHTEQTFTPPESFIDLRQNLAAPVETQLLVLAELVAASMQLLVAAFIQDDEPQDEPAPLGGQ